jgi:opacity protein-like surface antigen
MKKKIKSWDSQRSALATLAVMIMFCVGIASTTQVFAQRRAGRPPSGHELEGTPILPAGTRVIPDGTILTVTMDTRLNSGTAQVSDRFIARLTSPVVEAGGRTLLETGAIIEGHVASVKRARWAHRSGELGLSFDYVVLGDGRKIPFRATLVSGDNPIDEEGDLKAKSSGKRDVLVTSGGAAAGVGVGMVTGVSMLAGGGAGAAAGLTIVLIMKAKNVDIDPGERFNLELVQPISFNRGYSGLGIGSGSGSRVPRIPRPLPLIPRGQRTSEYDDPNSIRTQWSRVPIYDTRAERDRDGLLRVLVTAETSTTGWRIYTHHEVQSRDTLDIRLMGIPPSQYGARQTSHPSAPAICLEDRNNEIRRIIVHGLNGARYLTIGQGATSAKIDSNSQPAPSNPQSSYPPDYPPVSPPRPPRSSNPTSVASLATQTANQVEVLRANYAAAVGLWINSDGTAGSYGGRRTTATEQQLYDTLTYLLTSAKSLTAPSSVSNRQRAGQQLQIDAQTAQQLWQRVRTTGVISQDLDRQWQNAYNNLRVLSNTASR